MFDGFYGEETLTQQIHIRPLLQLDRIKIAILRILQQLQMIDHAILISQMLQNIGFFRRIVTIFGIYEGYDRVVLAGGYEGGDAFSDHY